MDDATPTFSSNVKRSSRIDRVVSIRAMPRIVCGCQTSFYCNEILPSATRFLKFVTPAALPLPAILKCRHEEKKLPEKEQVSCASWPAARCARRAAHPVRPL